jgi:glyoxylase-like metal-dependent hydrolase (beta-lactamase superfamily II)
MASALMSAVSERVFRIQAPFDGNAVHLYLVRGSKLALIDSGAADSPLAAVEPALKELGYDWSDLTYLLNTHGHVDHAGGNGELKASAPEVKIAIHRADRYLLTGPDAHLHSPTDSAAAMRLMGREDLLREREVVIRRVVGRSAGVDRELVDGDMVDLGDDLRLTVVHTPGHTAGSVCYFWESASLIFTGDAVQGHGWRNGVAPIYHDTVYVNSLGRIAELRAQTMCMGHTFGWDGVLNDPVRRGAEVDLTLQASRDAAASIDHAVSEALAKGGLDADFNVLAEAAFRELVYRLPLQFDRRTTFPFTVARAINAHLQAHGWHPPS